MSPAESLAKALTAPMGWASGILAQSDVSV
jgi:hypothetical protein